MHVVDLHAGERRPISMGMRQLHGMCCIELHSCATVASNIQVQHIPISCTLTVTA